MKGRTSHINTVVTYMMTARVIITKNHPILEQIYLGIFPSFLGEHTRVEL